VAGIIGMDGYTGCTGHIQVLERCHGRTWQTMERIGITEHTAAVQGDYGMARWNYLVSCRDLLAWCVEHFVLGFMFGETDVGHKRGGIKGKTCP
jgi:hypothetical protein